MDVPPSLAQQARQVDLGDAEAERVGGGGFQVMGLVDDQVIVFGQHAVAGGDIRKQQGVVDDQQVGALRGLAGAVKGAGAAGALHAHFRLAAFIFGGDAHPDVAFGRTVQVDLIAVAAESLNCSQTSTLASTRISSTLSGPRWRRTLQAARAEVIAAPFEHGRAQIDAERVAQVGDIFLDQLVLQVDRIGRNDHARIVLHGQERRRDEVGKGFARACAGLDQQVLPDGERRADRAQHLHLLLAVFVTAQSKWRTVRRIRAGRPPRPSSSGMAVSTGMTGGAGGSGRSW